DVMAAIGETQRRLAQERVVLAIGVSTVHPGVHDAPSAYQEARGAAECVGSAGGVLALPSLSALDYLTSFRDDTAHRLVAPRVQRFVADDLEHGGVLTTTLLAYVDC